jgi:ankyrin repeat protein
MKYLLILLLIISQSTIASTKWTRVLFESIDNGNYKRAVKAIKKGADVDSYNDVYNGKVAHNPVLIYALRRDRVKIAKLIVNSGADINLRRSIGSTNAAMVAARRGQLTFLKFLSHHKDYNPNLTSSRNRTLLFFAIWNKHYDVTEYLVSNDHPEKIDLNIESYLLARTVLERAVFQRDFRALKILLNHSKEILRFDRDTIARALDFCETNELSEIKELIYVYEGRF